MTERKRLHITPLNPQLLPVVLPPPILQQSSNISLHTIQTFPDKNYGYVDLPELEAAKLRKKLHGSLLKGFKMRVEEARPKKDFGEDDKSKEPGQNTPETITNRGKTAKAREEGVIHGHELHDRKVKRGWTEPASSEAKPSKRRKEKSDKKSKPKASSLTGNAECLFKTMLPPNKIPSDNAHIKKRKRGESNRQVIVHEFANTTKHANFLRDDSDATSKKRTSEYVEGKGWLDEDGNVVEAGPVLRRTKSKRDGNNDPPLEKPIKVPSRRSSRLDTPSVVITVPKPRSTKSEPAVLDDATSSSGTSSTSESDNGDSVLESTPSPPRESRTRSEKQKRKSIGGATTGAHGVEVGSVERLSITRSSPSPPPAQDLDPISTPENSGIHPLEALFKRPNTAASRTQKKPALEVSTSFNYLDPDADENGSQGTLIPQTPYTQQDIRQRRQRSAAPTPDTAAPGKTFGDFWEGNSDISAGDEDMEIEGASKAESDEATPKKKRDHPQSEFQKRFWEQRGETNRGWKRKRREATKEKRHNANKERKG
ncbi:hypothetical protein JMJ35_009136 [Cladonia borealis]|uniref:Suppressor protein SRP40 n=1 Tax=Cladonia borealis TaxID=184061 RepID=A0AA39V6V0_9LECA|nr:hypothetical protein JMJ35_009136 [Cladonia borealis]